MVRWGQGLVAWSTLAAVVVACGKVGTVGPNGSGGAASTGGPVAPNPDLVVPTTVAELCETYPAAWGDLMARCYGGEAADWASFAGHPCSETALAERAGRIALNQAKVAECFAVLAAGECLFGPRESRPQCSDLVTGSTSAEQPCTPLAFGDECAPNTDCHGTGTCAGICRPRGIEGESCHGLYVEVICGPGLDCDGPSARCKVPGAEGKPCVGDLCGRGLYCDTRERKEGICQPVQSAGPCQSSRACAQGFTCVQRAAGAGVCTRVKPTGAACTVGLRECAGYCSLQGTCRVVAQESEICGSLKGSTDIGSEYAPCGAGLFCNRLSNETSNSISICQRQLPLGATPPDTRASGNACDDRERNTFADPDTGSCTSCD